MVSAFVRDSTSSITFGDHFCGHLPSSINTLCQKYLEMDNAFHLEPAQYLNPKSYTESVIQIAQADTRENTESVIQSMDCVSKPFGAATMDIKGVSFRICVNVEKEGDSRDLEISSGLQLNSVPNGVSHITLRYLLRAHALNMEWEEVITMRPGDLVGPPSLTLCAADHPMNLLFDCEVTLMLVDGVRQKKGQTNQNGQTKGIQSE